MSLFQALVSENEFTRQLDASTSYKALSQSYWYSTGPIEALGRSYRGLDRSYAGFRQLGFSATEPGLLDLKNAVVNSTLLTQIIAAEECKVVFSYRIKNFLSTANATTDTGTY